MRSRRMIPYVAASFPPGPPVVEIVSRYVHFPGDAVVATTNLIEALRMKYGAGDARPMRLVGLRQLGENSTPPI